MLELLTCVTWGWHGDSARQDLIPVNVLEEWVAFYFIRTAGSCAKALAWVAVQQMNNQVLSLLRHADWEFKHAALDIIEQLVSVQKIDCNIKNEAVI